MCDRASSLATVRQRDASTLWLLEHSYGFDAICMDLLRSVGLIVSKHFLSSLIRVYPSALPLSRGCCMQYSVSVNGRGLVCAYEWQIRLCRPGTTTRTSRALSPRWITVMSACAVSMTTLHGSQPVASDFGRWRRARWAARGGDVVALRPKRPVPWSLHRRWTQANPTRGQTV